MKNYPTKPEDKEVNQDSAHLQTLKTVDLLVVEVFAVVEVLLVVVAVADAVAIEVSVEVVMVLHQIVPVWRWVWRRRNRQSHRRVTPEERIEAKDSLAGDGKTESHQSRLRRHLEEEPQKESLAMAARE